MQEGLSEVVLILVSSTLIILILIALVVIVLFISQKRKFRHRQELTDMKNSYEREVLQTQLETQAQTFEAISLELHDNVGTLISIAIVHLKTLMAGSNNETQRKNIFESNKLLDEALDILRDISRSINPENIRRWGLDQSFRNELDRLKRTNSIKTKYISRGTEFSIEPQKQIILFRIVQEAMNNVIKHSGGNSVTLSVIFEDPSIEMLIEDNGRGFVFLPDQGDFLNKSGIMNMKKRAKLINAGLTIKSELDKGTCVRLTYPDNTIRTSAKKSHESGMVGQETNSEYYQPRL